jgi:hypothetical protein
MDGKRGKLRRTLCRTSEPNRLEEELWATAYEQVWPLIKKVLQYHELATEDESVVELESCRIARRA